MSASAQDDGSAALFGGLPSPVPLNRGEVLVNWGGASTLRTYMANWVAAFFFTINLGVMASIDSLIPIMVLTTPVKAAVVSIASVAVYSATITSRCLVRAAVLEADGAHLRIYTYGPFFRPAAPVRVPLKLIGESEAVRAGTDTEALYACIRAGAKGTMSRAHLVFDKPFRECAALPHTPGSGLAWSERGLAAHSIPPPSPPPPTGGDSDGQRAALDVAAFRNYVLLVWLLQGNVVVDTRRLIADDWDLENMVHQLGAKGAVGAEARMLAAKAATATWRAVKDEAGRDYYYNVLTWETSWNPPSAL